MFRPAPLTLLFALAAVPLTAQIPPPASAHIVYTFEHPQLQPSRYTITIDETGAGRFASQPGPPGDSSDGVFPTALDRPILLDDSLRYALRAVAASVDARVDLWMGMPHGFPANVGKLKAATQALDAVGVFLTETLHP